MATAKGILRPTHIALHPFFGLLRCRCSSARLAAFEFRADSMRFDAQAAVL
jgi:hypothetical protein